jgi:hypothetical protein
LTKDYCTCSILHRNALAPINHSNKSTNETGGDLIKTVSMVASFGNLLAGPTTKDRNEWETRMFKASGLIEFPENWNNIAEEEKEEKLSKALQVGLSI